MQKLTLNILNKDGAIVKTVELTRSNVGDPYYGEDGEGVTYEVWDDSAILSTVETPTTTQ